MISICHLTKQYGKECVLNDITVSFEEGHIYGLVGPNGCGKTTLMRCIAGFTQPTSGTVTIDDVLIGQKRNLISHKQVTGKRKMLDFAPSTGIIIESPSFLPHYSGLKNLLMLCGISGKANRTRAVEVIRMVGLNPDDKKPVGKYSLGMRQRLGIAQAIMENPHILILDEPFNGLDADGVEEIHALLQSLKADGKIIILASHSAPDISKACDLVYIMKNGKLELAVNQQSVSKGVS